jgi:hypothetical protein
MREGVLSTQLDGQYCEKINVPQDLLGNFGSDKSILDALALKANGVSVSPVVITSEIDSTETFVKNIKCSVLPAWNPEALDKIV